MISYLRAALCSASARRATVARPRRGAKDAPSERRHTKEESSGSDKNSGNKEELSKQNNQELLALQPNKPSAKRDSMEKIINVDEDCSLHCKPLGHESCSRNISKLKNKEARNDESMKQHKLSRKLLMCGLIKCKDCSLTDTDADISEASTSKCGYKQDSRKIIKKGDKKMRTTSMPSKPKLKRKNPAPTFKIVVTTADIHRDQLDDVGLPSSFPPPFNLSTLNEASKEPTSTTGSLLVEVENKINKILSEETDNFHSEANNKVTSIKDLTNIFDNIEVQQPDTDINIAFPNSLTKFDSQNGVITVRKRKHAENVVTETDDDIQKIDSDACGDQKLRRKKNVSFCDQIILLPSPEEQENNTYVPNPILERVLGSVNTPEAAAVAQDMPQQISPDTNYCSYDRPNPQTSSLGCMCFQPYKLVTNAYPPEYKPTPITAYNPHQYPIYQRLAPPLPSYYSYYSGLNCQYQGQCLATPLECDPRSQYQATPSSYQHAFSSR